jgi:SAM-dependent methyltransferase
MHKSNYDYEEKPQGIRLQDERFNRNIDVVFSIIDDEITQKGNVKILEIGCGGGTNLFPIKQKFGEKVNLYGVDISKVAINFANNLNIGTFIQGEAENRHFAEEFDLILVLDVLEHLSSLENVRQTLEVIHASLKDEGCFLLNCPIELNPWNIHWFFNKSNLFADNTKKFFGHLIQFTEDSLLATLKKNFYVEKKCYHVHFISQLSGFIFFVLPKEIMSKLSPDLEQKTRDSSFQISTPSLGLRLLKLIHSICILPFNVLGYYESIFRKNSRFGAGAIYLKLKKRL